MPKTILLADDDRTLTKIVGKFLEDDGYRVLVANDGEEALKKLEEVTPDLLILDIQMPKLNGYSFLFEMRKRERDARIPVIVLTGREELEDIFRVEGIKEYLKKPVGREELLSKIKKYV